MKTVTSKNRIQYITGHSSYCRIANFRCKKHRSKSSMQCDCHPHNIYESKFSNIFANNLTFTILVRPHFPANHHSFTQIIRRSYDADMVSVTRNVTESKVVMYIQANTNYIHVHVGCIFFGFHPEHYWNTLFSDCRQEMCVFIYTLTH